MVKASRPFRLAKLGKQLACLAAILLLMWAAAHTPAWHAIETKSFDVLNTLQKPQNPPNNVVIVGIDEPSFQELNLQWPFPRGLHAQLVNKAVADGAKAVVFDVVFAEPSQAAEDLAFAQAIDNATRKGVRVLLAAANEKLNVGGNTLWTEVQPLQMLLDSGAQAGLASVTPDDDFVVRRFEHRPDTLAAQIAPLLQPTLAPEQPVPTGEVQLLRYVGPPGSVRLQSYYQAVIPDLLPKGFFANQVVLVGRATRTNAELNTSKVDMFNSPFASLGGGERLFSGVEVQANLAFNAQQGGIRLAPEWWSNVLLLPLLLLMWWAVLKLPPLTVIGAAWSSAALGMGVSVILLSQYQLWLSMLWPVATLLLGTGALQLLEYAQNRQQAKEIRRMFSQYVPSEVVAKLIDNPEAFKLGGENRVLTLMFTDLADFTAMSEQISPEQTVEVLTEYFNTMTAIIHRHQGTVDKFIGDAIMAFWGAPLPDEQHAQHAVAAAQDMLQAMTHIQDALMAKKLPTISMRIGVHTGNAVVGNVGSKSRFSYTAIGDAVNLASRLEGANKNYGTQVLLSEEVALQLPPSVALQELGTLTVKGKTQAVKVYTLRQAAAH